jgi:hypothetical protein
MNYKQIQIVSMAEAKKKKPKRKKIRYYKYEIKISKQEKEKIEIICRKTKSTPNKLLKEALREYMKKYADLKRPEPVMKNQMNIFDIIDKQPEQMDIFDIIDKQPDM